ncbi:hypothetical protein GJ744_006666 [Endocarpon pusillum]|uniref:Uncharacterized protein n=1 Tax=Endocarpon pusillum TaxID=364733 RepID=A0A8H7E5S8_9EURO|nr:hypothetical protein GJ744_006666 [Endocarpon pusillum]
MSYSMLNQAQNNVDALSDRPILPASPAMPSPSSSSISWQRTCPTRAPAGVGPFRKSAPDFPPTWAVRYLDAPACRDSPAPPPDRNTNRTARLQVDRRVRSIEFSEIAVWLCVSILAFLCGATMLVFWLSRTHFKNLLRDVDTVASVLGFVYESWGLLKWVRGGVWRVRRTAALWFKWGRSQERRGWSAGGLRSLVLRLKLVPMKGFTQGGGEQEEIQHGDLDEEHAEYYGQSRRTGWCCISSCDYAPTHTSTDMTMVQVAN